MTNIANDIDEQDELDFFTNPQLVEKAMQESNRGNFRPKYLHFIADIKGSPIQPWQRTLQNGTEVKAVMLEFTNMEVLECVRGEVFADDSDDYIMNLPRNPSSNSEVALMVASAGLVDPKIKSLRHFAGLKKVEFEERAHHYTTRRPTHKETDVTSDNYGKDVWEDVPVTVYYYHVVSIGGSNKGTPKKSTEITLAGRAAAMTIIVNAGADGISTTDFGKAAVRDKIIQADTALMAAIEDGSFISKSVEDGTLKTEDGVITSVA